MEPRYLSNGPNLVRYMLGKIREELQEPNLSYVLEYERQMRIAGKTDRTIARHLRELRFILRVLGGKDAKQATEKDIENVILATNNSKLAPISKRKTLLTTRVFFAYLNGFQLDSHEYPQIVRGIKNTLRNLNKSLSSSRKSPDQLLTLDEIKRMVEVADTQLEKTLVMLLASTGSRVGEVLNLKISSLQLLDNPKQLSHITFSGKTGTRTVGILPDCVPFLKTYLETDRIGARGDDPLFIYKRKALDFDNVRFVLKKLANKAGIKKKVHSHIFRYYLSTYFAQLGRQESQMSAFFGYTPQLASHYTRLANADSILDEFNTKPSRKSLAVKECPRCRIQNPFNERVCKVCLTELGADDTQEAIGKLESKIHALEDMIEFLVKDKDLNKVKEDIRNRHST